MTMSAFQGHVASCPFAPVDCEFKEHGCEFRGLMFVLSRRFEADLMLGKRADLVIHLSECIYKKLGGFIEKMNSRIVSLEETVRVCSFIVYIPSSQEIEPSGRDRLPKDSLQGRNRNQNRREAYNGSC